MFDSYIIANIMAVLGTSLAIPMWSEVVLVLLQKERQVSMSFALLLFTAFLLFALGVCSILLDAVFLASSYYFSSAAWISMAILKKFKVHVEQVDVNDATLDNLNV